MNVLDVNNDKTIECSTREPEPEANNDDNLAVVMDTNNTDNSGLIVSKLVDGDARPPEQPEQMMSKQSIVMSMICTGNGASGEMLNLREILQLFNCAISQEQAWAVLYQVLSKLKYLLDNDLTLVKLNQDTFDINALNFTKDGAILFNFKHFVDSSSSSSSSYMNESDDEADVAVTRQNQQHLTKNDLEQERNDIESKVLKSVAYLIFDALDYGNTYMNEPVLQSSLSHLLLLISGHYKEYNNGRAISEDDEGYEQEEEDSIDIDKAIEICNNNLAEAEYHCKAVCRGLYAQAYELKVFLAKIEDSKNILQKSGKDPTHYCFEVLDKTDWAKLWMQVIHELRNGVKLRKVCEKPEVRRHIEYELTPFEILLDQIRARRYHLKKVSLDASLGPEIKKDARDIILEFIRSRPPLKKCSQRTLKQSARVLATSKSQPVNLHEQLMISIRNYSTPLRKIEHLKVAKNTNPESTNETNRQPKRLIKADKKLLNNLTSSDDDDSDIDYEELKNLPILQEDDDASFVDSIYMLRTSDADNNFSNVLMNLTSASSSSSSNAVIETKKRIKAPESLRSPLTPWHDPVENWRALVTEDVLDELGDTNGDFSAQHQRSINNQNHHHRTSGSKMPNRRHTMTFADLNRVSSTLASINIFSGFGSGNGSTGAKTQQQKSLTSHSESREFASDSSCKKKLTSNGDANNKECLRLTFDELCHIRNVLTKAELDYLLFDNQIYQEVSKGKVCFSCRKTKFHLFNWGTKCRICQQKICKKCLRTAQLKNGQMAQVPVFKLSPTKYKLKLENTNPNVNNKPECLKTDYEPISCDQHAANHQHHYHHRTATSTASPPGSQLFEICVDCYQMMEGVVVSANERDLGCETDVPLASSVDPDARPKFTSAKPTTTTKILNIKSHDKGDTMDSLPSSMSPSPSSVKSTEEILNMLVIKDLNIVDHSSTATSTNTITTLNNNNNNNNNANGGANYASPLSFHSTLSHHSTPNLKTSIVIEHDVDDDSDDKPMDDLSTIILTDNQLDSTSTTSSASFQTTPGLSTSSSSTNANILNTNNDTQNSNPKFIRENLTLDLHPVYVNYHHHHHH